MRLCCWNRNPWFAVVAVLLVACGEPTPPTVFRVAMVELSPDTVTRRAGETVQFTATLRDSTGREITGGSVEWSTSVPSVAQVSQSGLVTTLAAGIATITAASQGQSASATITVWIPEVVVGAGDIADCGSSGASATALLLDAIPGTVFTVGDNAYPDGTDANYTDCYDPTWGRHKARTRPAAGNHEYRTPDAAGYFNYFGAAAGERGKGYYSYDLGLWHVIVLNSNLPVSPGSEQEQWLRADLAATSRRCTVAYWHHPRFSSGTTHGSQEFVAPLWDALNEAGADLVVGGHEHNYERFAPQRPDGTADPATGIRQFVVGTGGGGLYGFGTPLPTSEARGEAYGVLKLTLRDVGYDWEFVPVAGGSFVDSGSGTCR